MPHKIGRFNRVVVAVLATTGLTLTLFSPPAQATPGCVTPVEFFQVRPGMHRAEVHDIFDTRGKLLDAWLTPGLGFDEVRYYRKCPWFDGGRGLVGVNFDDYTHSFGFELRMFRKVQFNPLRLLPSG